MRRVTARKRVLSRKRNRRPRAVLIRQHHFQRPLASTQELATTRDTAFHFAVIVRPDEIDSPGRGERVIHTERHVRHAFVGYAPHLVDHAKLPEKRPELFLGTPEPAHHEKTREGGGFGRESARRHRGRFRRCHVTEKALAS